MTRQRRLWRWPVAALGAMALSVLLHGAHARATTLAYWRFGDDPGGATPAAGDWITPTAGRTTVEVDPAPATPPAFVLGRDSSGNGNSLYTWDDNFTGHNYRTFVPNNSSLRAGVPNNYSIQNNGSFPATFTWSLRSSPSLNIQPITPAAWTIEASIYKTSSTLHQTFVGRDGNGVAGDGNLAPLYFKTIDGNLQILFTDVAGNTWNATDNAADIALNTWYNVAAVSNGSTLSLYKDSGSGYQLVASTNISSSANSVLAYDTIGSNTPGDTQWGWTIGRGRYGTDDAQGAGHTDRWFGYIDEVRISDAALTPDEFLFLPKFSLIAEVTKSGPNAGAVMLRNIDTVPVAFNYYVIGSAASALSTTAWNSLSDQGYDASLPADFNGSGGAVNAADLTAWKGDFELDAGSDADDDGDSDGDDFLTWQRQLGQAPGLGDSWDEAPISSNAQLAELFLNSASTLNPGESVSLGNAYNTAVFGAANGDLTFKYGIPGQPLKTAAVVYVSGSPTTAVPEPPAAAMTALCIACVCMVGRHAQDVIRMNGRARMGRHKSITLALLCICLMMFSGCEDLTPHDVSSLLVPEFRRSEIVGFLAGFGTTFAAVPDLVAMLRRRSSAGMNPRMAAIMAAFQILWVYYGLLILSRPVIAWNAIAVLTNSFSVGAYLYFARKEKR